MKTKNLTSLSDFIDEKVGLKGSKKRDEYDNGFEAFKLGVLIQQARQEKGLTQERLAETCWNKQINIFQNLKKT